MYDFAFCYHQAITQLDFISSDRLMFETLDTPPTDTDYRLIAGDNGDTLLEIFIQPEGQDIPIPSGYAYRISLPADGRLAITVESVCPGGDTITSYLKRTL
jgi:hypothetical protein